MKYMKKTLTFLLLGCAFTSFARSSRVSPADTVVLGYGISELAETASVAFAGVGPEAFENAAAADITKSLYGKIAGLNVYQGKGSSADNISTLSVHGNAPLVLVDGFPRDITDLTSEEIESVCLFTDAVASALYGTRGANGVLMVTTRRGNQDRLRINAQYQLGINTQFRAPDFSDSYTYAKSINAALAGDGLPSRYSEAELDAFRTGIHPYEYPDVDWWKASLNDVGLTHDLKMTFDGGNSRFRYFTVVDYYRDRSMLKQNTNDDRYSTKPTDTRLSVRTNLDLRITETTFLRANLAARLQELNGTVYGRKKVFGPIYGTPSAAFPVKYADGTVGGSLVYADKNPVALLKDKGHIRNMYGTLLADLDLRQNLDAITEGLAADILVSFDNIGGMNETSTKSYSYMNSYPSITSDGTLVTTPVRYGTDTKELGHTQPFESLLMRSDIQAKLSYERAFGEHGLSASAVYDFQSTVRNDRNNSFKNQSVLLNVSYVYGGRYSVDAVVNYSGSSYLPDGRKYYVYPAVSAAWVMSEENFLSGVSNLDLLKVRASYGVSGWDGNLTHELWRQSYGSGTGYLFGNNASSASGGAEGSLPVVDLKPERSEKATLGVDLGVFGDRLAFSATAFKERRSDVLVSGSSSTSGIIGIGVGQVCEGEYDYRGVDLSLSWRDKAGDFSYGVSGTASYLDTEIINENQAFQEYDYLYHMGNRIGQRYGLEAIGFFGSQMEINNSPAQTFSTVRPGDVKYKDQNGDNVIDSKDVVKMFGSTVPRLYFGFSFELGYKGFELLADFQGMTGVTTSLLDSPLYMPLVDNGNISDTFLSRETPWTPENMSNATMPRLTTLGNANNYRASSLWYRDASFIKLRNLVLSYTFPKSMTRVADVKVFVQGNNLFSLDNIGFADPEQLGAAYPSVRSFWAGLRFNF